MLGQSDVKTTIKVCNHVDMERTKRELARVEKWEKDNAYMPSHLTKRYTLVEEISSLATFLASDSSNNIIGQIISVDGGWTLQ